MGRLFTASTSEISQSRDREWYTSPSLLSFFTVFFYFAILYFTHDDRPQPNRVHQSLLYFTYLNHELLTMTLLFCEACRSKVIKMKEQDPSVRFRLEKTGISKHTVETKEVGERGLEAPEEYWVELSQYESDPSLPPVDPSDYVWECVNGTMKPGATWHD